MTRSEAIRAVITMTGGVEFGSTGTTFRFPNVGAADRCKAILDAILPPGSTGAVGGPGLLVVSTDVTAPLSRLRDLRGRSRVMDAIARADAIHNLSTIANRLEKSEDDRDQEAYPLICTAMGILGRKPDSEHEHMWGLLERSRLAGTTHRKCIVPDCNNVLAYDEYEADDQCDDPDCEYASQAHFHDGAGG